MLISSSFSQTLAYSLIKRATVGDCDVRARRCSDSLVRCSSD